MTAPERPAASPPALLGAVLAGGRGRRFGGPKAGVPVGGTPMVRRAVDALASVTDEVVVVSSTPVPEASVTVVPDRTPGKGPLGGLETALREARARGLAGVFLLACDLPLVDADLLEAVLASVGEEAAAAPGRDGGGIEPLCAVYRVDVLAAVERCLASGDLSLHALFRDVGGTVIPAARLGVPEGLLNVNTPEDRRRAEDLLESSTETRRNR